MLSIVVILLTKVYIFFLLQIFVCLLQVYLLTDFNVFLIMVMQKVFSEYKALKSLHNFPLINPLSLSSFNFLLTLDLTLSILSFLNNIFSDYSVPSLSFC